MSLYNKTKYEFAQYFEDNYSITQEIKSDIINECIDGEVLFEMTDKDFKDLMPNFLEIQKIKNEIQEERANLKEKTSEDLLNKLISKLISFGIKDPIEFLFLNENKINLKFGAKILLQKLNKILSNINNKNSNIKEIYDFLENIVKISKESRNLLEGLNFPFLFELIEKNDLEDFDINEEDKIKLKKYINYLKINNNNIEKDLLSIKYKYEVDNEIENKLKLEEMIIYKSPDNKKIITMEDFYKKFEFKKKELFDNNNYRKYTNNNPYNLKLEEGIVAKIKYEELILDLDLSIGNLYLEHIFETPIKTKIKIKKEIVNICIISINQIDYCLEHYGILVPYFKCNNCDENVNFSLYYFLIHRDCNDTLIFDASNRLELENEQEFKNYFPQKDKKEFSSHIEFERNFVDYYDKFNQIGRSPFTYYDDIEGRNIILSYLGNYQYFGKYLIFYGLPGIGKSVLVNYVLKYKIDHSKFKTFYIHCKILNKLVKYRNYIFAQDIFLSEIPFLFYNDYQSYIKCANIIKNYDFRFQKQYQDLIELILNYLSKKINNKYIIVFDQYNNTTDPEGKIKKVINSILGNKNISNNFSFFFIMTLDNKDNEVKQYKIDNIFGTNKDKNNNIIEIKNIFYDAKFKNINFQNIYEKLGKTVKNYVHLKDIKENKLEEYYDSRNTFITKKILRYLNKNEKENSYLKINGMSNLIKLSFNEFYTKEEIISLSDYINFKFFDIQKINEKYQIRCLFHIIEEILKKIYHSFIICNNCFNYFSINMVLTMNSIKGGGKQYFFQEIIMYNLYESYTNHEKNIIIPDLIIDENIKFPRFISKSNNVNIPYIDRKKKLDKYKTYLIDQEEHDDKSVDFIIVDNHKKEQEIFAFQVNYLNDTIFKEDEIKEILNKMIYYLQNFFRNIKVKKENLFYGYIFSFKNNDNPEFKLIINKCKGNKMAFSYYNFEKNNFEDSYHFPVKSIYDMVKSPYEIKPILTLDLNFFKNKRKEHINNKPKFEMNKNIKENLINLLENLYHKDIKEFEFKEQLNRKSLRFKYYDFYYSQDEKQNSFILIQKNNKYEVYNLENSDAIDIENYLKNEDIIFDCFLINFKMKKTNNNSGRKNLITVPYEFLGEKNIEKI